MPENDHTMRALIDAALSVSVDKCARCKICDNQVGAVMAALREYGPYLKVAVTRDGDVMTVDLNPDDVIDLREDDEIGKIVIRAAGEPIMEVQRFRTDDLPDTGQGWTDEGLQNRNMN